MSRTPKDCDIKSSVAPRSTSSESEITFLTDVLINEPDSDDKLTRRKY